MHLSHATLLSLALPLALSEGTPSVPAPKATVAAPAPKTAAAAELVIPSEVLELARAKRVFDQEDVGLVTRVMHQRGVDNFVLRVDPTSGEVSLTTDENGVPHLDIKPGSCPNPLQLNGAGLVAGLPTGVIGNAFDVTQVSLPSTRLQRPPPAGFMTEAQVAPIHINLTDVGTPFHAENPCDCAALGPDGILDINAIYNKADVISILELGGEANG